jgi:lambda family phage portal protein
MLDVTFNQSRDDKNKEIRLGVELDADDAPVAYHFCEPKSFAYNGSYPQGGNHVVVPAKDIIHIFPKDRIGQTRGWPLIVPIMEALKNLNEYEKSEMTAARIGSNQVGFLETPTGAEYDGSTNDDGTKSMDLEAGEIRELPAGQKFTSWDPKHPTDAFSEFVRSMKLSMAAGVSVSYPTFTGDLTGVNFSSIRAGLLEDREEWKSWQTLFIEGFAEPVFAAWLEASLTNQSITLPLSKFDKFNSPEFIGRRWAWVDPLKDANANKILIEERLTTRTRLAKELGLDYEELLEEIKTEQETEKEIGISPTTSENTNPTEYNPKDEEDDEEGKK